MYSIGDKVRLHGEREYRMIIGIRVQTYIGFRGNVSTQYILYLGEGLWKTSKEVVDYKKSR